MQYRKSSILIAALSCARKRGSGWKSREFTTTGTRASVGTSAGVGAGESVDESADEEFDPHITLGEIDLDKPQADVADVQRNLKHIEGKKIKLFSHHGFLL